ncbi:MAG: phage holin family protein [Anaerolineales bacterium]|jgi:putative membrane protein|nr:phage holin family protein [Anaerolineales bacterium]
MIGIIAFLARFFTAFAAILGAVLFVPGISLGGPLRFAAVALILASANTSLKGLLARANLGCSVLSLGPILLAINSLGFWFADELKFGVSIAGFWPAFWAGLLVSLISFSMYFLVSDGS